MTASLCGCRRGRTRRTLSKRCWSSRRPRPVADLDARMAEGFGALVDELPQELSPDERAAWAIGYLYALAAGQQPKAVRSYRDGVLGTVFEVDEAGGAKVAYVVMGAGMRLVPVRVYVR